MSKHFIDSLLRRIGRAAVLIVVGILFLPIAGQADEHPNFSGTWKLSGERSVPPRVGDVTLKILQRDPLLDVETTVVRGSETPRHALQHYTTDGRLSVTTGADGDEFHTSIIWTGQVLAFSIVEHEDGRVLPARESWSLLENGALLQRVRERPGGEKQTLVYTRKP